MSSFSWLLFFAISLVERPALCVPQGALITGTSEFLQSAAPELVAPIQSAQSGCGGCYLVADVAGVVWYQEVFLNTAAIAVVSVGVGNGTSATRTSIYQNEGQLTVGNPTATTGGSVALTQINYQPTANIEGAKLTSPTAYNVFTAYSITSAYLSNGICVTSSGNPVPVSPAYSEILSSANGRVTLDENGQQSFINYLGFSTCSGGAENFVPAALLQVKNTTATTTSTFSNVPLAAVVASLTIAPQSVPAAAPGATTTALSTTIFPSVGVPEIVIGNTTVTPNANPIGLSIYNGTFTGHPVTTSANGVAYPTGSNFTNPEFFQGTAALNRADAWLVVWATAFLGLGAFVYYL